MSNMQKNLIAIVVFILLFLFSMLMRGDARTEAAGIMVKCISVFFIIVSIVLIPLKKNLYDFFF